MPATTIGLCLSLSIRKRFRYAVRSATVSIFDQPIQTPRISLSAKQSSRERSGTLSAPLWLLLATILHRIMAGYIGIPLLPRHYYNQLTAVAVTIGANWILWRFIRWFLRRVRNRALALGHGGTGSLMLLGERIIKAVVVIVA